jgi:hypothetical protein
LAAYAGIDLTARQSEVVRALKSMKIATDAAVADHLNWQINQVCGRITELKEKGIVIECGNITGRWGKQVRICKLKEFQETLF